MNRLLHWCLNEKSVDSAEVANDMKDLSKQQGAWTKMTRWTGLVLLCACFCLLGNQAVPTVSAAEMTRTISEGDNFFPKGTLLLRNVPYVNDGHERHTLDLFVPEHEGKIPLLVWIHGGAWVWGDKNDPSFYRFVKQGYAVASINYRLSQHAVFPAQILDCKSAIRWLKAHAPEYGIDPKRVGVGGASAGGHLASLVAATGESREFDKGDNLDQSSRVDAVCDFFGPVDFERYEFEATSIKLGDPNNPFVKLMGGIDLSSGSTNLIRDLKLDDEKRALIRSAEAISQVTEKHPPIIIFHGNKDDLVPSNQSEYYLEALREKGVESSLYIVNGAGHGFDGPNIWRLISIFFDKHLKPEKKVGYKELLLEP